MMKEVLVKTTITNEIERAMDWVIETLMDGNKTLGMDLEQNTKTLRTNCLQLATGDKALVFYGVSVDFGQYFIYDELYKN